MEVCRHKFCCLLFGAYKELVTLHFTNQVFIKRSGAWAEKKPNQQSDKKDEVLNSGIG